MHIHSKKSALGPSVLVKVHVVEGVISRIFLEAKSSGGLEWKVWTEELSLIQSLDEWFTSYLNRSPQPFPLLLPSSFTPFQVRVLKELQKVPFGQTLSYGDLASLSAAPRAARAVGSICRINPVPFLIPCHRVLLSSGKLGGFAYGSSIKQQLLDFELL